MRLNPIKPENKKLWWITTYFCVRGLYPFHALSQVHNL